MWTDATECGRWLHLRQPQQSAGVRPARVGRWSAERRALRLACPRTAASNPGAEPAYVGCQGVSTCTAVGYYTNQSSVQVPIVVQINNGTPSAAVAVPVPGDAVAGQESLPVPRMPVIGKTAWPSGPTPAAQRAKERAMGCRVANGTSGHERVREPAVELRHGIPARRVLWRRVSSLEPCEAVGYYEATSSAYSEPMCGDDQPRLVRDDGTGTASV